MYRTLLVAFAVTFSMVARALALPQPGNEPRQLGGLPIVGALPVIGGLLGSSAVPHATKPLASHSATAKPMPTEPTKPEISPEDSQFEEPVDEQRRGLPTNGPDPSQETASLVKRLAGPSTTKAGLAKDQSEINRIIAEASKGSHFYENEKRKDKDLTHRIERIIKQRDEVSKGVDIRSVERKVDHLQLVELEAERDLSQMIVHVDMDAFYANVELLDNPKLDGKPFGVGMGVLTTASYEARKYGVRSGMPAFIAQKLCPELTIVPINMSRYSEMSKKVMNIFRQYDSNLLAASVDEAYLNITAYCAEHSLDPEECVRKMRQQVVDETQLTNKPNGQFCLPHESKAIIDFMHDLSIRKIPGVGRVNERLLDSIGIKARYIPMYPLRSPPSLFMALLFMMRTYLGIASNVVEPWQREERKSIGTERTFNAIGDTEKILQKLDEVAAELESDMERGGWTGKTVTLKYKLDTYQVFTRAKSSDRWITKKSDLFATGKELLQPELPLRIRLIGLRVTKLKDLRKSDDGKGIKRFFEPAGGSETSPSKKSKASHLGYVDTESSHALERGDEDEETMPGFHEHEYEVWDGDLEDVEQATSRRDTADNTNMIEQGNQRHRPPNSAPASSSTVQPHTYRPKPLSSIASTSTRPSVSDWQDQISLLPSSSSRPRTTVVSHSDSIPSGSSVKLPPHSIGKDSHRNSFEAENESGLACPLCAQVFSNNDLLNSHVDWCLSKEAIRAAQTDVGTAAGKGARTKVERESQGDDKKGLQEWWKVKGSSPNTRGGGEKGRRGRTKRDLTIFANSSHRIQVIRALEWSSSYIVPVQSGRAAWAMDIDHMNSMLRLLNAASELNRPHQAAPTAAYNASIKTKPITERADVAAIFERDGTKLVDETPQLLETPAPSIVVDIPSTKSMSIYLFPVVSSENSGFPGTGIVIRLAMKFITSTS
ncbi:hypothetical protein EW146_g3950 [Bondarzewia mesenterica]|uniref:DNA polymerase kappa n=1 Tax=Bondarzewia mesenterica TaxID=1095465 RepID=A0A4S4LW08_9AGAM|nr:hypothetical protein EW146_g3950 [Bondarzewia mesenterica]